MGLIVGLIMLAAASAPIQQTIDPDKPTYLDRGLDRACAVLDGKLPRDEKGNCPKEK